MTRRPKALRPRFEQFGEHATRVAALTTSRRLAPSARVQLAMNVRGRGAVGARLLAKVAMVFVGVFAVQGLGATSAHAATCSDYSNQAAAQRAADTRDADGDGVYCEDLPCPCLGAGGGGGTTHHHAKRRPRLGHSVLLGDRSRSTGCRVHGGLPDARCTPGAYYPKATRSRICHSGYSESVRSVSDSVKEKVYAEYGISHHHAGQYEVDHLVPLEAGGSNVIANLFPQAATPRPGFHEKDRLENAVRAAVCDDGRSLRPLQRRIARDWISLYDALV